LFRWFRNGKPSFMPLYSLCFYSLEAEAGLPTLVISLYRSLD
jgi:hypothetical protein